MDDTNSDKERRLFISVEGKILTWVLLHSNKMVYSNVTVKVLNIERVFKNCGGPNNRIRDFRLLLILSLGVILYLVNMWGLELHHHDGEDPCGTHEHAMVFHSCVCAEILFNGWATTNAVQLFGSAVAIFVAAVLYEGFKCFREEVTQKRSCLKDSQMHLAKNDGGMHQSSGKHVMLSGGHVVQTLLHFVQSTVSYMLMLIFMTYNVWLCLALVLGLTVGYFLFGWRRGPESINDSNECCQ